MYEIYPEARQLEAKWKEIRDEFLMVQNSGDVIPGVEEIDKGQRIIAKNKDWKALVLRAFRADNESNMKLCPTASNIIKNSERTVSCFYSIVEPHKTIPPHTGYYGGVLRYHLGIIIPKDRQNCWIRVKDTGYSWKEGRGVMFDDLYNHEVWNNTNDTRVVLFIDVIRPVPMWIQPINKYMLQFVSKSKRIQEAISKAEIRKSISLAS